MTTAPRRNTLRLPGFDYASPRAYFVTVCTYRRECLFGRVEQSKMRLGPLGLIVQEEWLRTGVVRSHVEVDTFAVMPNHLHGILILREHDVGATRRVAPTEHPDGPRPGSLGAIVGQFKSMTSRRINELRGTASVSVWQRGYYEHVIRGGQELAKVREYIQNNDLQWALDRENPECIQRL